MSIVDQALIVLDPIAEWVVVFIVLVGLLQTGVSMVYLVVAGRVMRKPDAMETAETRWHQSAPTAPPISLVAAAYNEEATIVESVRSLLDLRYPNFDVIVVNDGSKDSTLDILINEFNLYSVLRSFTQSIPHKRIRRVYRSESYRHLFVVDKENGGKADALNAGIDVSRTPIFCAVDADSMLESEALLMAVKPFLRHPEKMIAVGGTIRPANGCLVSGGRVVKVAVSGRFLPLIQTLEYIRAFLIARVAMSWLGILTLISGAFGVFSREAVIRVGGYATDTVGEDYELILRLHRHHIENDIPYEIQSIPEPVCWTEVPEQWKTLSNQRRRWQRGGLEAFFRHREMVMNPKYGRLGTVGMSFALITDVFGPITEFLGYLLVPLFYFTGLLNVEYALAFLALTFVMGMFFSAGSLVLEEVSLRRHPSSKDLLKLGAAIFIENFGYRQISNFWRLQGTIDFMRKKQGWGKMQRTGFRKAG